MTTKKWKSTTRGGYPVEIWKEADARIWGRYLVTGMWILCAWDADGKNSNVINSYDLIEDKPEPRKFECFIAPDGWLTWREVGKLANQAASDYERIPEFDKVLNDK